MVLCCAEFDRGSWAALAIAANKLPASLPAIAHLGLRGEHGVGGTSISVYCLVVSVRTTKPSGGGRGDTVLVTWLVVSHNAAPSANTNGCFSNTCCDPLSDSWNAFLGSEHYFSLIRNCYFCLCVLLINWHVSTGLHHVFVCKCWYWRSLCLKPTQRSTQEPISRRNKLIIAKTFPWRCHLWFSVFNYLVTIGLQVYRTKSTLLLSCFQHTV